MRWNRKAKCLGRLKIDGQFDFGGLLDRQIGWFLALENPAGIKTGDAMRFGDVGTVTHQTADHHKLAKRIDPRDFMASREFNELVAPVAKKRIRPHQERPCTLLSQRDKGHLQLAI